jgi:putative restriction endonuclease|tara:strand:- start:2627 stop:3322 length:696 start_codon:yes stop_codon:yes gene_type:complete
LNFEHWIVTEKSIGKSSATKYSGAISGRLSKMVMNNSLSSLNLLELKNPQSIALKLKGLTEFIELNSTGNSMYSRALDLFIEYSSIQEKHIESDISEIIFNESFTVTEKDNLVKSRIGQGKFRQELMELWGCCSVTKCEEEVLLVASHIKPWRSSSSQERLDKYNGLLLIATVDKAFDSGLISFNDNGNILIAEDFKEHEKAGITKLMKVELIPEHVNYMKYHRENVYKGI